MSASRACGIHGYTYRCRSYRAVCKVLRLLDISRTGSLRRLHAILTLGNSGICLVTETLLKLVYCSFRRWGSELQR